MSYPEFVEHLKDLKIKKKAKRPKVSPNKMYPHRIELEVQSLLRDELMDFGKALETAALTNLDLPRFKQRQQRFADGINEVSALSFADFEEFEKKARELAYKVDDFATLAFSNYSEMAVGERYFPNAAKEEIIDTWTQNFVTLCKSTTEDLKKKVSGDLSDAVMNGRSITELTKQIQSTVSSYSRSKAELIATTETAKLNTAIAKAQSKEAGIEYYEWGASMDGRTRESHALMDGRICKWGDNDGFYEWESQPDGKRKLVRKPRPAKAYKGAPGTDFRCRCVALPYVPEYEDDYEEGREKGAIQGVAQGRNADIRAVENPDVIKRDKSIQKSLSRSFALINERNRGLPKEKQPVYTPFDVERAIWVDQKRLKKYNEELNSNKRRKEGDERDKFEKEVKMSEYLREIGLGTILVEEQHSELGRKQPDAVVDGRVAEFKQVKGNADRVKDRISDAIEQGAEVVGLEIVQDLPLDKVNGKIKEATKNHPGMIVYFRLSMKTYKYESK